MIARRMRETKIMKNPTGKWSTGNWIARLARDRRGVAAVEFAFVFPILLVLYMGSVEITDALAINKRVGKVASSVADLITQSDVTTRAELRSIAEIGEAILYPYRETSPVITMVGIRMDDTPTATARVAWSARYSGGGMSTPLQVGSVITVPASLRVQDSFVVMTETQLRYKPIVTYVSEGNGIINMGETFYLRPRLSAEVECPDC